VFVFGELSGGEGYSHDERRRVRDVEGVTKLEEPLHWSNTVKWSCSNRIGGLTKNSKIPIVPIVPSTWEMDAMTAPNRTQHESSISLRKREMRKRTNKTVVFHTMGPIDTTVMRMRGLGGV
jgi:hypothetical protein